LTDEISIIRTIKLNMEFFKGIFPGGCIIEQLFMDQLDDKHFSQDDKKIALKKRLVNKCVEMIEQRITAAAGAIANAQAAANAEEKSSAGDKYETSRAMSHLEKDMHARQLSANRKELAALFSINFTSLYDTAVPGAFIDCKDCSFFIAAGLGKINFEGMPVYLLSPQSPMAVALFKKKQGDTVIFNKILRVIDAVF